MSFDRNENLNVRDNAVTNREMMVEQAEAQLKKAQDKLAENQKSLHNEIVKQAIIATNNFNEEHRLRNWETVLIAREKRVNQKESRNGYH